METTTISRNPLPGVRRIALAFILASGLIAGSFAVVAGDDEKPASAAPVAAVCNTGTQYQTIPPAGGSLSGPTVRNTDGMTHLVGSAENKVWVVIRGLDNGVWITRLDIDPNDGYVPGDPGDFTNSWINLGGATTSAPRIYAPAGTQGGSDAMVIRTIGTDGHVYGRTLLHNGWSAWYAVSVSQTTYYGVPLTTSTVVEMDGEPDALMLFQSQNGVPKYRCDLNA